MAIVKRYNTRKFFYSDRIKDELLSIYDNPISIVEAPTGFGKTTSVKNVLNDALEEIVWITVENEDNSLFYMEICNRIETIDKEVAVRLRNIGYPDNEETVNKIVKLISEIEFKENYIFVFDNFQFVSNEYIVSAFVKIIEAIEDKIKIVLITQNIKTELIHEKMSKNEINYIGKNSLEFNKEEIRLYFRECGIKLDDEEINYLSKYTEGWISALYLQMLHYVENNKFEEDAGIDKLVCMAIWDKLSFEQQDFLISIAIYDSFSLKQALFIGSNDLKQDEIKSLLSSNSFIRYDSKERKFYIHAILKYFLKNEFDKLDIIVRKNVFERAAKWYEVNEDYYSALLYYYKIKKYDDIYYLNISLEELLPNLTRNNKEMFLDIIKRTSIDAKEKNVRRSIVFSFVLFYYNEKDFFENECEMIKEMITESEYIRQREKDSLLGETEFINAFLYYNDLDKMYEKFNKAYEYMKSPSTIYTDKVSLIFRNPSVLSCFHSKTGDTDRELEKFQELLILYYKITSGNSKGLEAVMRAELLYNNGNFKDAQLLCEKALYMAETRGQIHVYICTMFLMARIAIFEGDYDNFRHIILSVRSKLNSYSDKRNLLMTELSEGWLYMTIEKYDSVSSWLKNANLIEERISVFNQAVSNVIFSKYLLYNEQYEKFLGISGQMLGSTRIFDNLIYEIYIYIYIAIANYNLGNKIKSYNFINEAIELSCKDKLYMPFVENYVYLDDILKDEPKEKEYIDFIENVKHIYKKNEKNYKHILNGYKEEVDYGLTNRELQIAKLAAARFTNKEIAEQLYISSETVKSTLKIIFSKLNICSRSELKNFFVTDRD